MTSSRIFFLGLLGLAAVLFVLNPGPDKFRLFLQERLAEQAESRAREAGEQIGGSVAGSVGGFLAQRLGRRGGDIAADLFEREDYYVASVYSADLNGRQPGGEVSFLGIAGWFFPLEEVEI
jgi:hypothetical protein